MMGAGPCDDDAIVTEKPELKGKIGTELVPAGPCRAVRDPAGEHAPVHAPAAPGDPVRRVPLYTAAIAAGGLM
jgi:hypothetical protein